MSKQLKKPVICKATKVLQELSIHGVSKYWILLTFGCSYHYMQRKETCNLWYYFHLNCQRICAEITYNLKSLIEKNSKDEWIKNFVFWLINVSTITQNFPYEEFWISVYFFVSGVDSTQWVLQDLCKWRKNWVSILFNGSVKEIFDLIWTVTPAQKCRPVVCKIGTAGKLTSWSWLRAEKLIQIQYSK